jgi:Arc/MetJ family transcription regulator
MRTTIEIDDELFADAQARFRAPTKRALVEEALRALIRESASRRLAEAGGTMPEHRSPPRRRPA